MGKKIAGKTDRQPLEPKSREFVSGIVELLEQARWQSARAVNSIMTATYWEVGRRVVEQEQAKKTRAEYGEKVIELLSAELTSRFGRGFAKSNIYQMRGFYLAYSNILQTVSGKSGLNIFQTLSGKGAPTDIDWLRELANQFPLPWSHYVLLLGVKNELARKFYEKESLRGGWAVRQLYRQINSQFFERTALSRNKAAMLEKGSKPLPEDRVSSEEEIKSPYVLEFLGLKDEYSETDLEDALVNHLGTFLLELGDDFAFVARQKRLRLDNTWYRVDLVFFHRRLRSLLLIDLKVGEFTHADAGQMHLYLNYAREHWTRADENPPVGLILCAQKSENVVKYALDNLPNKIMAAEYLTALPQENVIAEELERTQRMLEMRKGIEPK
jgi:predicted nuclease of restriction endonuclease-like (RecB) superfamily